MFGMAKSRAAGTVPHFGHRPNVGAYEQPFSGVGVEFEPLGIAPGETGFVLHETGYWPHDRHWNFPNVYSPFWRVMYEYKAGHAVRFGKNVTPLKPGRFYIIPNHQRFDCMGDPPVPSLWFALTCARNADPRQPMPIVVSLDPVLKGFVSKFPKVFRSKRADRREAIRRMSISFLVYLLGRSEIRWQPPLPEALARTVAAVNADPSAAWENPMLARHAHMSVDSLIRLFRRWMNSTPARYVTQVRIREACRLLIETEESIEEIADRLGFPDRFYFTRVFKRITGSPPAQYRREHSALAVPRE